MTETDPLDAVDWPLHTERLLIRRCAPDDVDAAWHYRRLPEVHDWLSTTTTDPATFAELFIQPGRLAVTLMVELDGVVIGDLMLRIEDAWAQDATRDQARRTQAELGWALDPAYGGRGHATEAVHALIDLCFGPLGLRRVHADCFLDNEPSWRLMERLGMRRELHSVKESLHRRLGWIDGLSYAVLAEEWPIRRTTSFSASTTPKRTTPPRSIHGHS